MPQFIFYVCDPSSEVVVVVIKTRLLESWGPGLHQLKESVCPVAIAAERRCNSELILLHDTYIPTYTHPLVVLDSLARELELGLAARTAPAQ